LRPGAAEQHAAGRLRAGDVIVERYRPHLRQRIGLLELLEHRRQHRPLAECLRRLVGREDLRRYEGGDGAGSQALAEDEDLVRHDDGTDNRLRVVELDV
jgi:hypothetical protein